MALQLDDVAFGEGEDLGDGLLMAAVDEVAGLSVAERPGDRHALGGTEGQVKSSDGFRTGGTAEYLTS